MEYTSFMTNDAFLKLKCDACKNCLSYFPICISGDKKNICGRCSECLAEDSYAHNEVYEAVAQFIKFPCRYKSEGCLANVVPKDVVQHEKVCDFQTMKCPTNQFTNCDWKGSRPSGVYHCQSKHSDLILTNAEFRLNLSQSYQRETFLKHDLFLFVVTEKFYSINKLMEFSIYNHRHDPDFQEFKCEVNFKSNTRSITVQCLVTAFENKKVVDIFLDALNERDNVSTSIVGKITFEGASHDVPITEIKNDDLLSKLTCSVCQDYILPPIYSLQSDQIGRVFGLEHKIYCSNCKNKSNVERCKEFRERGLEEIANMLNYPCQYTKSGCSFKAKPLLMRNHLESCAYGVRGCPVNEYVSCTWFGFGYDVVTHICGAHDEMILNSSTVTEKVSSSFKPAVQPNRRTRVEFIPAVQSGQSSIFKCYIIKFSNHLFRLSFAEKDEIFFWDVQMIGPFQSDYMFELEVLDSNNRNSFITKQSCGPLKKKDELIAQKECYFRRDQIATLLSNEQITFKVHVYQQESLSLANINLNQN